MRRLRSLPALLAALPLAPALACLTPPLPEGVTCDAAQTVRPDAEALSAALMDAPAGTCVLAPEGAFVGAFAVPPGVKLIAGEGASFASEDEARAALTVRGGEGSGLFGARVTSAAGEGVRVEDGPAALGQIVVEGAEAAALVIMCPGEDCVEGERGVSVVDATLRQSAVGLLAHGALVEVEGGESSAHEGAALSSGYGVIATAGAQLSLSGTLVDGNAQEGVVIDGETTIARLTDVTVSNNEGRGVWAQGLRGSADMPALTVEGEGTVLEGNGIAGLGAVDAWGIIFVNGSVVGTVARPVPTDLEIEEVGDGVGLFGGTGEVRLDGVSLTDNARSQLLVDEGQAGIIFVNGTMAGELKAVIQATEVEVTVPAELVSDVGERLGVVADRVQVPSL